MADQDIEQDEKEPEDLNEQQRVEQTAAKKSKDKKRLTGIYQAASGQAGLHVPGHTSGGAGFNVPGNHTSPSGGGGLSYGMHPKWLKNPKQHWPAIKRELDKIIEKALLENWEHVGMTKGRTNHKPDPETTKLLQHRIAELMDPQNIADKRKLAWILKGTDIDRAEAVERLQKMKIAPGSELSAKAAKPPKP